jgi:hypothetical protein
MVLPACCYRPPGYLEFRCPPIILNLLNSIRTILCRAMHAIGELRKKQPQGELNASLLLTTSPSSTPEIKIHYALQPQDKAIIEQALSDFRRQSGRSDRVINGESIRSKNEINASTFQATFAKICPNPADQNEFRHLLRNYETEPDSRKVFYYTVEALLSTFNNDLSKTINGLSFLTQTAYGKYAEPGALSKCFQDDEFEEEIYSQRYSLSTNEAGEVTISIINTKTLKIKTTSKTASCTVNIFFSPDSPAPRTGSLIHINPLEVK